MIQALIPHSTPPEGPGSLLSREDRELLEHVIDRLNVARGRIDDYENCGIIVESATNKLTDLLVRAAETASLAGVG